MTPAQFAATIDQTLLKPTAGLATAAQWVEECRDAGFASLCVSPSMVPLVAQRLAGSTTKVCSVIGFPLGYSLTETKAEECAHLASLGCQEFDMVMNVAEFLEGDTGLVRDDIAAVVASVERVTQGGGIVKVILETGYLTDEQIAAACTVAVEAGAAFVKTSTGFGPRGASVSDVEIMRAAVGPDIGVKAAGGIRDLDTALALLAAGATRLGTSAGLELVAHFSAAE